MITCCVRYVVNLQELDAFREYASIWVELINRLGGQHHGYFLPLNDAEALRHRGSFSFPGMAAEGRADVAVALYSFPDWTTYEAYRRDAPRLEECHRATQLAQRTRCFTSYERTFLTPAEARGAV